MLKLLIALIFLAASVTAGGPPPKEAQQLYQQTKYQQALKILSALAGKDASVHALIGKCRYGLEDFKKAADSFEEAIRLHPGNSEYLDWLGKAYGRRAERSSFFTAPGYASKARDYFKKAVELDPKNLEAVSDLFEYYLEAPGLLGGGLDKAAALAETVKDAGPAEYHYHRARLAEKRKDFQAAEREFRTAAKLAPEQAGRLIDLAAFLSRQGRFSESDTLFREAERTAPNMPQVLFAQASAYVRAKRNLDRARRLLEQYLDAQLTPEDPSRKEAEQLLRKAESG